MRSSRRSPRAWSQSRGPTGAFATVQRASLPSPAVEHSPAGARRLGDLYRHELNRSTFGLVRVPVSPDAVVLRPLGIGPALLRFGFGQPTVTPDAVTCRYAILRGLLARTPGGWIAFTQTVGSPLGARRSGSGESAAVRSNAVAAVVSVPCAFARSPAASSAVASAPPSAGAGCGEEHDERCRFSSGAIGALVRRLLVRGWVEGSPTTGAG